MIEKCEARVASGSTVWIEHRASIEEICRNNVRVAAEVVGVKEKRLNDRVQAVDGLKDLRECLEREEMRKKRRNEG